MLNIRTDEFKLLLKVLPFVRLPPEVRGHNLCMGIVNEVRDYLFQYFYEELISENSPGESAGKAQRMVDDCFKSHTQQ